MNQIIFSNNANDSFDENKNLNINTNNATILNKKASLKTHIFKLIFIVSNLISIYFLLYYIISKYKINQKEELSKNLSNNFGIKTLYSSDNNYTTNLDIDNYVIGIIEIKKIGINYPIINESTDDNLEIAPCRFFGPSPNQVGNLCIVAHNYNNYKFFSKIYTLSNNDIITIYDLSGKKIDYFVYDKFEVYYNDLNCTNQDTNGFCELTLITCNNIDDNKRIIVKAKEKRL